MCNKLVHTLALCPTLWSTDYAQLTVSVLFTCASRAIFQYCGVKWSTNSTWYSLHFVRITEIAVCQPR